MIAEGQRGCLLPARKVVTKLHLPAQRDARTDPFGLAALGVTDCLGQCEDLLGAAGRHEQHAIVIAQDQILAIHCPIAHGGRRQRVTGTGVEAQRTGRDRSHAEDRQPDRAYVGRIAMQPPDHDPLKSCLLGFQSHEVADTALVETSAVIDYQHIAWCSFFEGFEEDVDAAGVPGWGRTPGEAATRHYSAQLGRPAAHWRMSAKARIRQVGARQGRKPLRKLVVIHIWSWTSSRVAGILPMALVICDMSISLDGYVTGPNDSRENPFGDGAEMLHDWMFDALTNEDRAILREMLDGVGAVVMGRKSFDKNEGNGGWGDGGPLGDTPCFVVTHNKPITSHASVYTFVTDGVVSAIDQAKSAAGDKVVGLHGATVMQQALPLGLVDEIRVHVIPVLLGGGTLLFGTLGSSITLERTQALVTPAATHIRFRVVR